MPAARLEEQAVLGAPARVGEELLGEAARRYGARPQAWSQQRRVQCPGNEVDAKP